MAKKSQRPVGRPSKFPKLTNSKPDIKTASEKAYKVTANCAGKVAVAAAFDVSYQTLLDWLDPDCPRYKGEEFSESIMRGLAVGQTKLMQKIVDHMVEGHEDDKINMGATKWTMQHMYGMVDKTQVDTTALSVNISQDLADDVG